MVDVKGDGNCLFRALSDQMYDKEDYQDFLRENTCNAVSSMVEEFSPFLECEANEFLHKLSRSGRPRSYTGIQQS